MTVIKVRLGDADRAEYGVSNEELIFDVDSLKDMRSSENAEIDQEIGMALQMFTPLMEQGTVQVAHVGRIASWLALRAAGISIKWADFDPRLGRATFTVEGVDQRPPAGGPSEPSPGDSEQKTSSAQSKRSSASKLTSTP